VWAASAAPLIAVIAASAACDAFGSNDPTEEPVDAGTKPAFCDKHHEALACLDFENADPEPTRGWVGGLLKSPFDKVYQDGKLEIETRPNDAGKRLLATALGNTKYGAIQMKPLQGSYWTLRMRVQIDATAPPPYEVQVFNIKALAEGSDVKVVVGTQMTPYVLVGASTIQQPYIRAVDFAAGEHTITIRRFFTALRWAIDDDDEGKDIQAGLKGDIQIQIGALFPSANTTARAHVDDILLEKN